MSPSDAPAGRMCTTGLPQVSPAGLVVCGPRFRAKTDNAVFALAPIPSAETWSNPNTSPGTRYFVPGGDSALAPCLPILPPRLFLHFSRRWRARCRPLIGIECCLGAIQSWPRCEPTWNGPTAHHTIGENCAASFGSGFPQISSPRRTSSSFETTDRGAMDIGPA